MADQIVKKSISTRLVMRNADLSAWELSSSKQLLKGEIAIAKILSGEYAGSYKMRIGVDGKKTWNELSDQGQLIIPAANVEGLTATIAALSTSYYETSDIATLSDKTYVNGDIAVEKVKIGTSNLCSYCAYRYNSQISNWQPLDGNYDASKVFFGDDVIFAGNYTLGNKKTTNDSVYTVNKGTSLKNLMEDVFTKDLSGYISTNPATSKPTLVGTAYASAPLTCSTNGSKTAAANVEVGTILSGLTVSGAAFTTPQYKYGPATGVVVSSWATTSNNGDNVKITQQSYSNASLNNLVMGDKGGTFVIGDVTYNVKSELTAVVTAKYTDASTSAYTNTQVINSAKGFPDVTVRAGSVASSASNKMGCFRARFWGYRLATDTQLDFDNLTSAQIRALQSNGTALPSTTASAKATNFTVPAGTKQIILLEPTSSSTKKIDVYNNSSLGAHMDFSNGNAKLANKVTVEGANGYTGVGYDVWYLDSAAPFATACNLAIAWK